MLISFKRAQSVILLDEYGRLLIICPEIIIRGYMLPDTWCQIHIEVILPVIPIGSFQVRRPHHPIEITLRKSAPPMIPKGELTLLAIPYLIASGKHIIHLHHLLSRADSLIALYFRPVRMEGDITGRLVFSTGIANQIGIVGITVVPTGEIHASVF